MDSAARRPLGRAPGAAGGVSAGRAGSAGQKGNPLAQEPPTAWVPGVTLGAAQRLQEAGRRALRGSRRSRRRAADQVGAGSVAAQEVDAGQPTRSAQAVWQPSKSTQGSQQVGAGSVAPDEVDAGQPTRSARAVWQPTKSTQQQPVALRRPRRASGSPCAHACPRRDGS